MQVVSKEQVLAWARQKWGDTPYTRNYELMLLAWKKEFGDQPIKVADIEDGEIWTIEVLVVAREEDRDIKYMAKPDSWKKCEDGEAGCVEASWRFYIAGDDTGVVHLKLPPWSDIDFEVGAVYRVKGKAQVWVKKNGDKVVEFIVSDATLIENPRLKKAIEMAQEFMELKDWSVDEKEFVEMMKEAGFEDYIDRVKVELGLIKKEGKLVKPSEEGDLI